MTEEQFERLLKTIKNGLDALGYRLQDIEHALQGIEKAVERIETESVR